MNRQFLNRWHNSEELAQQGLPDIVHQWLGGAGSMTHAMRNLTENQLELKVLSSEPQLVCSDEASLLGASPAEPLLTREVLMQQDGEPLLYGRSVFPASLPEQDLARIQSLGSEPLGELLFSLNEQPRMSMQYAMLDQQTYLYQALAKHLPQSEPLYARRSLFKYQQDQVLVQEVFLTAHPVYALVNCD